jgi:hypothetical protein
MAHRLRIDSSITGEQSTSRRLSARGRSAVAHRAPRRNDYLP